MNITRIGFIHPVELGVIGVVKSVNARDYQLIADLPFFVIKTKEGKPLARVHVANTTFVHEAPDDPTPPTPEPKDRKAPPPPESKDRKR